MRDLIGRWTNAADHRAVFLECYALMTGNVLKAIDSGEFRDAVWVDALLHRFAGFYFDALDAYETAPTSAPIVWQIAHDFARKPTMPALQHLFLGINAHINYDLVLTLFELLEPEWSGASEDVRESRFADHCHVNAVIARTIDTVQDRILERLEPALDLVDRMLGPIDEWVASQLIARWRDEVWHHAVALLELPGSEERERLRQQVEALTVQRARAILLEDGLGTVADLI